MPLKWRFPKFVLWIVAIIFFSFPIYFFAWFLLKFDLPLIHGGDKVLFNVFAFVYWIASGIFIFGYKLRNNS